MVNKATLVSDTFSQIFNVLNKNVYEISNSQGEFVSLDETDSGNYWTGSYPHTELITDQDEYPIGVLDTPEFDEDIVGLRLTDSNLEIDITVYDTRAEHPPKFVEKAVNQIRNNDTLKNTGLYNVRTVDSTNEVLVAQRGGLKIHSYTATVELGFEFCA